MLIQLPLTWKLKSLVCHRDNFDMRPFVLCITITVTQTSPHLLYSFNTAAVLSPNVILLTLNCQSMIPLAGIKEVYQNKMPFSLFFFFFKAH